MEQFVIPVMKSDDDEKVKSKSDFNSALATNVEMQLSHRAKLLSEDKISAIWDLTSDPEYNQNNTDISDKVTETALEQLPGAIASLDLEPEKEKGTRETTEFNFG